MKLLQSTDRPTGELTGKAAVASPEKLGPPGEVGFYPRATILFKEDRARSQIHLLGAKAH